MAGKRVIRLLVIYLVAVPLLHAGTATYSTFTIRNDGVNDSNFVQTATGLALGIKRTATIKLYGDTLPGPSESTLYSDVMIKSNDIFELFYVSPSVRQIKTQLIELRPGGIAIARLPVKAFDIKNVVKGNYLHTDRGTNGYLASYVQETDDHKFFFVMLHNGTRALPTDSSDIRQWISTTQCHMAGDTFIVMNMIDTANARMFKIYSRSATLVKTDSVNVLQNASPGVINGALAVDSAGTILAATTRGKFNGSKRLGYQFFNRDLSPGPAGTVSIAIGENVFYHYDDVAVASYGRGKFAVVSWDGSGVLLHKITLAGSTITHDTIRVITKPGMKFCTVATSNRYMIIASVGDVDGNGVRGIEGVRYLLVNGEPDSAHYLSYSDPAVPVFSSDSSYSGAINATVDDSGSAAITWRNGDKVHACIWGHRPIRYKRAFYRSAVDSLRFDNDSLMFNPVSIAINSITSWSTDAYVRMGTTVTACTSSAWLPFTDNAVLSLNKTTDTYYQSMFYLERTATGVVDSFSTPTIASYTTSWNVQPEISGIDSIRAGPVVITPYTPGERVVAIARKDTVALAVLAGDADNGDVITLKLNQSATPQQQMITGGPSYRGTFFVHPLIRTDTVYTCTVQVSDAAGWYGAPVTIPIATRNCIPEQTFNFVHWRNSTGNADSLTIASDTTLVVQEEDSLYFFYAVSDSNDNALVFGAAFLVQDDDTLHFDTVHAGSTLGYRVAADTLLPTDTVKISVQSRDVDTTIGATVHLIVNHRPTIRFVEYRNDTLSHGDTTGVIIDDTATLYIAVSDTDCSFGDTLTYYLVTPHVRDTVTSQRTDTTMKFVPENGDTSVLIRVVDRFGRSDSSYIHLAYPWFETDSIKNPTYAPSLRYLADSVSLIAGSGDGDTITVPIINSGRDPLVVTALSFAQNSASWLMVRVVQDGDTLSVCAVDGLLDSSIVLPGDSMVTLLFCVHADALTGDTLHHDTVTIHTNAPRHRTVPLYVRVECNDLPKIVAITPYYISDAPYRAFAKKKQYTFPPHAHIAVAFSEPMDTMSAADAISLYSVLDRNHTGIVQEIPLTLRWLQNTTIVHISPDYSSRSPYFKLTPPPGLFIPTDSIALRITDRLHDVATTPSGPNMLDVDNDLRRQQDKDTTIYQRIDSIAFTVAAITPSPGDTAIARTQSIRLAFSSPFYAASVDTSLADNRSFRITSSGNNGNVLPFSSVSVDSSSVTFQLQQELFYRDSITCYYTSKWIRDSLGYASDNSKDGIDITIFDSLSHEDDLQWGYRVIPISVIATTPESASVLTEVSPQITLQFDGKIPSGVFDFDTSKNNRSFRIGSARTGYSSFRSIHYLPDSTGIVFQPLTTFFSNDSVSCQFTGFTAQYRYSSKNNLPADTAAVMGAYSWFFTSGEIGFYTYPNPYKPGSDPRHCGKTGPCGIWFKNLHTFSNGINEVAIAIYNVNAHPVFDTRDKGIHIRFNEQGSENLPQWKWNTLNTQGDPVASGLYLYGIYSTNGSLLKKGKLVIVR